MTHQVGDVTLEHTEQEYRSAMATLAAWRTDESTDENLCGQFEVIFNAIKFAIMKKSGACENCGKLEVHPFCGDNSSSHVVLHTLDEKMDALVGLMVKK